jgi:hypothetical protein
MLNVIDLVMLIATAALLIWSGFRAWRVRNSFLKWGGVGLAAVLAVAVSSVSALTIAGMVKQHARSAPGDDLPYLSRCGWRHRDPRARREGLRFACWPA